MLFMSQKFMWFINFVLIYSNYIILDIKLKDNHYLRCEICQEELCCLFLILLLSLFFIN
jgi:hypothetical protein